MDPRIASGPSSADRLEARALALALALAILPRRGAGARVGGGGGVAIGIATGSVAVTAFGIDSIITMAASLVLLWELAP